MCFLWLLSLTLFYRPYLDWLDFVLAQSHLPLTISTSYGDDEQTSMYPLKLRLIAVSNWPTVPKGVAQRACANFAQLGAVASQLLFSWEFIQKEYDRCSWYFHSVFLRGLRRWRWRPKSCYSTMLLQWWPQRHWIYSSFPSVVRKSYLCANVMTFWHFNPNRCPLWISVI